MSNGAASMAITQVATRHPALSWGAGLGAGALAALVIAALSGSLAAGLVWGLLPGAALGAGLNDARRSRSRDTPDRAPR